MHRIEGTFTETLKSKKKGNEDQYKHNIKILNKMKEAENVLDVHEISPEGIYKAKRALAEGTDININHRQKFIKVADSSELGCRVVHEYESNPLASDSDDEKRLYKAEKRVERKAKAGRVKLRNQEQPLSSIDGETRVAEVNRTLFCMRCEGSLEG